jgi:hypothetical protein
MVIEKKERIGEESNRFLGRKNNSGRCGGFADEEE